MLRVANSAIIPPQITSVARSLWSCGRVEVLAASKPTVAFMEIIRVVSICTLVFQAIAASAGVATPTYSKDVAPILIKHCGNCHRERAIASSVPLLSYDAIRPWAKAIKQKVLLREMPPWPADPNASLKFRNDARLSQGDINTLVAWINAGTPKGDDADLPRVPEFVEGWSHPKGLKPDLVISLPGEFEVPAKGEIPYLRYFAKVPLTEDKWIVASQARPSNPAVVHHMAFTEEALDDGATPADMGPFALLARQLGFENDLTGPRPVVTAPSNPAVFDMLAVYTPGTTLEMYPEDSGKLLKAGKNLYINFNIHYQASGKPEKDRSMIAFWFGVGPPKHQLFQVPGAAETIIVNGKELLTDTPGTKAEGTRVALPPIPPFAESYEVVGVTGYVEPVTIYQFHPHAHVRAKDFNYTVIYPDGREQIVLSVPKYDFRWQLTYELETPLKLPEGSKMVVTAHYDNSRNNKYNPAPEKEVYFRDQNQSWDEMFTPFIQYSIDSQDLTKPPDRAKPTGLHVLQTVEVVGCLEQSSPAWKLVSASEPAVSTTQSTTSMAIKALQAKPLGNREYQLLGVGVFNPSDYKGQKVAIKGLLINDVKESRLNVTSLQTGAEACIQ